MYVSATLPDNVDACTCSSKSTSENLHVIIVDYLQGNFEAEIWPMQLRVNVVVEANILSYLVGNVLVCYLSQSRISDQVSSLGSALVTSCKWVTALLTLSSDL